MNIGIIDMNTSNLGKDLLSGSNDLVIVSNSGGDILYGNATAHRLLGYKQDELVGRKIDTLVPEGVRGKHRFYRAKYSEGEIERAMADRSDLIIVTRSGDEIPVLISICNFDAGEGKIFVAFIRDIRYLKDEERARIQNLSLRQNISRLESVTSLVAGIAHDLNNLLTIVQGNCEIAMETLDENGVGYARVGDAYAASSNIADLVRKLSLFSGAMRLNMTAITAADIISKATEEYMVNHPDRVIRLENALTSAISIKVNPEQFQLAIFNILDNAFEAQQVVGKPVRVRMFDIFADDSEELLRLDRYIPCVCEGSYCCVEIVDSGCGLEDANLNKVYDPFFTTKFLGRGLGLTATLGILRSLNGAINIESQFGIGTTVSFIVPSLPGGSS